LSLALAIISFFAPQSLWAKKPVPICTPQVPCADPRGCSDLSIDAGFLASVIIEFRTFAPTDCAVDEGMVTAGARKLLRFVTQTNNSGPGALFLGNPADHFRRVGRILSINSGRRSAETSRAALAMGLALPNTCDRFCDQPSEGVGPNATDYRHVAPNAASCLARQVRRTTV